ncbi:MAG: aldo/keto reductase [Thermoanaerobaculia bacterium]
MSEARLPDSTRRPLGKLPARVSPVGFGGYRVDDRVARHREALRLALLSGVNLVDTSTNYGDGHSELLVGKVLREMAAAGEVAREDVVVVTKAGYVQGQNLRDAHQRRKLGDPWPEMTEYSRDCWHCISPAFLRDQLSASLGRLAMPRVDLLLLHNPEYFLVDAEHRNLPLAEARDAFYDRMGRAFEQLEKEVAAGRIGAYGVSSNTFVVPHEKADAVDLLRLLDLAGPGFAAIQLPMNPVELGAREPIHTTDGRSVLDVAREHGLAVLVNRPLNGFRQGRLHRFASVGAPFPLVETPAPDALARLRAAEEEFALVYAPRLSVENGVAPPEELLSVSPLLGEFEKRGLDLGTFREVWDDVVEPRRTELLAELREVFDRDADFGRWADGWGATLLEAASALVGRLLPKEEARAAELAELVTRELHESPEGTLSQRTLKGLADVPGATCVLVGMRRPEYVRDVVGAFGG